MTTQMEEIFTKEQFDFIQKEANKLAEILLEKDVSKMFEKDGGNANFVLNVSVFFVAGIISIISKTIRIDPIYISKLFMEQVEECINSRSTAAKPILSLVH